ncbi:MAG TPA: pentapeptide repeat-containing protein [Kofleriaceae bacterium]|nr:pentapeptide repeat-containing protein [Kofleriaceae bacterium]
MDDERVWTPAEIARRYLQGERDFRGLDISDGRGEAGASFRGVVLDGADFSRSFIEADFTGARLCNSKFVEANVKTCTFDGADLRDSDFSRASIDAATFTGCRFDGAQFEGAGLYGHRLAKGELPDWPRR